MGEVIEEPAGRSDGHWYLVTCALLGPLGLVVMAMFFKPDERGFGTHEQLGMSPCFLLEDFGFPCPGCGVTTSVTLATHGQLLDSLLTQPLGLVLVVSTALFSLWTLFGLVRGRDTYVAFRKLPLRGFGAAAVAVTLFSWIYKCIVL
ncbi:MAG: hypothetical protein ACI8TQ_001354 [Planctomycetota bacterium]|jgi:hypothetical protein